MTEPFPAFLDGSSPYPTTAENLDIVHDCDELAGSFPANVAFKFIYSRHECGVPTVDGLLRRATLLGPHLIGASLVGLEVGGVINIQNPEDAIPGEYKIINRKFSQGLDDRETQALYDRAGLARSTELIKVSQLVEQLNKLGAVDLPIFAPMDTYTSTGSVLDMFPSKPDLTRLEVATLMSAENRQREGVVLRHLHAYARILGESNQPELIVPVEGSNHFLTAVAARTLGARVSEVFLDKPNIGLSTFLEHTIRFDGDPVIVTEASQQAKRAARLGHDIFKLAFHLRMPGAELPDNDVSSPLHNALALLVLRADLGTLAEGRVTTLGEDVAAIAPFFQRPLPLRKRKLRDHIEQILGLSRAIMQE